LLCCRFEPIWLKIEKISMVSVIIPTYNRAHLIGRAVQSVLNQTHRDFEIIIIDDGSTDKTLETINRFDDSRIKYIRHLNNKGAAAARNTGIRAAKGEYIAFLDSDDEWLPEKLEEQIKIIEGTPAEIGVIYAGCRRIMKGKEYYIPSSRIAEKEGRIFNTILRFYIIYMSSVIVKSDVFRKLGLFDESLPPLEDWDLWIRISKQYFFKYVDKPLVISHYTLGSISTYRKNCFKAAKLILKKHFREFKKNKKALINFLKWMTRLYVGDFLHKIRIIKF